MFPISLAAPWQPVHQLELSAAVATWLTDSGSLTEKLKGLPGLFQVQLLQHTEGFADDHEYRALQLAPQPVWIREVLLRVNQQAMVYARSILPVNQPTHSELHPLQLGTTPLGEVLFSRPHIHPGPIEIAQFPSSSAVAQLNQQLHGITQPLWGRRRVFPVTGSAILVSEVFLSAAPCYA